MNNKDIREQLEAIIKIIDGIVDPEIGLAVRTLLNLIENLLEENEKNQRLVKMLQDEINRLKGEQGKPKIRPQSNDNRDNHSSEKDRNKRKKKKKKKRKSKKKHNIKIDRRVICKLDQDTLPKDAISKGYKSTIIQDIKIITDHIEFKREVFYSPSLKKTFMAKLPDGYEGEFGPNIKSHIIALYHESNMTEPAIERFLRTNGVMISKATISRILTEKHDIFHQEKEAIIDAGLQAPYQQIDDTSARVNGKNHHVHILCHPFYTAYFTRPKKDRMTLLRILCRGELKFLFNAESFKLMIDLGMSEKRLNQIKAMKPEGVMSRAQVDNLLSTLFPNPKKQKTNRRYVLEATALIYYRSLPHAIKHLMCDNAPQFNYLAEHKSLCWIHEGRPYKKLNPIMSLHQKKLDDFLEIFWDFYQKLLDYTCHPTQALASQLRQEFDEIFSKKTGYQKLDDRINLTRQKKQSLLLPLTFPFLPLHNNDSENGAQHQARLRDIHLQTRHDKGTKAKDTFTTIVKTARKLNVNLFDYFYDRVSKTFSMSSLASIILEKTKLAIDSS